AIFYMNHSDTRLHLEKSRRGAPGFLRAMIRLIFAPRNHSIFTPTPKGKPQNSHTIQTEMSLDRRDGPQNPNAANSTPPLPSPKDGIRALAMINWEIPRIFLLLKS